MGTAGRGAQAPPGATWGSLEAEPLVPAKSSEDAALADTLTVASGDPGPGLSREAAPRPLTHRNCEMIKVCHFKPLRLG